MDALANLSPEVACRAWSWFTLACAACGGATLAMVVASLLSCGAYSLGYEDACIDHGIAPEAEK
jgi:hypothetical protein